MTDDENEGDWLALFQTAIEVLDDLAVKNGSFTFSIGGGTMLMRRYRHRVSRDLDIFVDDLRLLRRLSPRANDLTADLFPDYEESANAIKFIIGMQEIDVIAAASLTDQPTRERRIAGRLVSVEEPREIIAKKLYYRGRDLTHRDIFDLATVASQEPSQLSGLAALLRSRGLDEVARRLGELAPTYPQEVRRRVTALSNGFVYLDSGAEIALQVLSQWRSEIGKGS